ncbi:hypothetical protein [Serinibacter salmoneus]|uniref:Uncharacterized protein n=1 Tax=Serinibacter salmoneus TaxID=556530 RepID=A0A2A9D0E0_9MICO|nr:hypothetical protein [Serinibacter salmoneus]PFG19846.1 hypothetical protein ATL40_1422 [Serinibacter salmoneus]
MTCGHDSAWMDGWAVIVLDAIKHHNGDRVTSAVNELACGHDLWGALTFLPAHVAEHVQRTIGSPMQSAVPVFNDHTPPHVRTGGQIMAAALACDADNLDALAGVCAQPALDAQTVDELRAAFSGWVQVFGVVVNTSHALVCPDGSGFVSVGDLS